MPAPSKRTQTRRSYPRDGVSTRVLLKLHTAKDGKDNRRSFEATLPLKDLSISGAFVESTFFLKVGTLLSAQLALPSTAEPIQVDAEVVRVQQQANAQARPGFALRFVRYQGNSHVELATYFLTPVLRGFVVEHAKKSGLPTDLSYVAQTCQLLAAWELKKASLESDVWELARGGAKSP